MGGSGVYKELEEQALPLYEVKNSKRFIKVILSSSVDNEHEAGMPIGTL